MSTPASTERRSVIEPSRPARRTQSERRSTTRRALFDQLTEARDEVFGPVLAVLSLDTEEEEVTMANDTRYGRAAGIYSDDARRARCVADLLDAGQVVINRYGRYDFASPFGGFRARGWGREMGHRSPASYTRPKAIWIAH